MKIKNIIILFLLSLSVNLISCAQPRTHVTVIRTIPRGTVVVHAGVSYHYVNGIYYRPCYGGYTVVRPPLGVHINVLPVGFVTVNFGGIPYYCAGGVYYIQPRPNVYEVVEKPSGLVTPAVSTEVIAQLPDGTEPVTINGRHYYRVNDTYYEKLVSENGSVSYKIAGKKE